MIPFSRVKIFSYFNEILDKMKTHQFGNIQIHFQINLKGGPDVIYLLCIHKVLLKTEKCILESDFEGYIIGV